MIMCARWVRFIKTLALHGYTTEELTHERSRLHHELVSLTLQICVVQSTAPFN